VRAAGTRHLLPQAPELGGGVLEEEGERGNLEEEELLGRPSTVPLRAVFPALRSLVVATSRRRSSSAAPSTVPPRLCALPCLAPPLHWRKGGSGVAERSRGAMAEEKKGSELSGETRERGGTL
jgi:hypothetical protein